MTKRYFLYLIVIILIVVVLAAVNRQKNEPAADSVISVTPTTAASPSVSILNDQIKVESPAINEIVKSPLVVKGQARGGWYFEAVFPVRLLDGNGKVIAEGQARAQGEWMTENFVPFIATLQFTAPSTATGTLILVKDNPSGLPQNDAEITIPIKFTPQVSMKPRPTELSACQPSGCSGEICSDQNIVSTCVFKSEYACYDGATCERQPSGKCGWTETPELLQCLAQGGL